MDKNTLTGLVLIAAILIGFSIFNTPSETEFRSQQIRDSIAKAEYFNRQQQQIANQAEKDSLNRLIRMREDSIATADALYLEELRQTDPWMADSLATVKAAEKRQRAKAKSLARNSKYGSFAMAAEGEDQDYILENEKMKVVLSGKGGRVTSVAIKGYKKYDSYEDSTLNLMDKATSGFGLYFTENGQRYNTNNLYWETKDKGFEVTGNDSSSITFRLYANNPSQYLEYTYGLAGNSYHLHFDVKAVGLSHLFDPSHPKFRLDWKILAPAKEKSVEAERRTTTVMFKSFEEKRDYLYETGTDSMALEHAAYWVDFKQNFFSAFIVNEKGFLPNESMVKREHLTGNAYTCGLKADLVFEAHEGGANPSARLEFMFAPNHFQTLQRYNRDYEQVIDLGWGIFGWVNQYLVIKVFNWLEGTGMSYGIIILILTLLIKSILLPITYRTYKSSAKMRVLKPEMEALTKKYPDKKDAMKKQQEQMALYRKTGVNPLAGCVPMLIQMPILYAMFRFFPSSIELRQEGFLWADDLSAYDSILDLGFNIPFYGAHISLFTLLMAGSTILYTRMNSGQMTMGAQPGMPNMKVMMYLFPVMMLFFFNSYSSGLSYYYFLANMISIGQMWLVKNYFINEGKIREKIEENKKRPKKKSKFQERLEEVQRQQREKTKRK